MTHTWTRFEVQRVNRTAPDLTTITNRTDIARAITVITVAQPASLTEDIVSIIQVVTATCTCLIFLGRTHAGRRGVTCRTPDTVRRIGVEPRHGGVSTQRGVSGVTGLRGITGLNVT